MLILFYLPLLICTAIICCATFVLTEFTTYQSSMKRIWYTWISFDAELASFSASGFIQSKEIAVKVALSIIWVVSSLQLILDTVNCPGRIQFRKFTKWHHELWSLRQQLCHSITLGSVEGPHCLLPGLSPARIKCQLHLTRISIKMLIKLK